MGRRSDHSREQLAAMVIDAARAVVVAGGVGNVSMRGIAARIGYAPGSIYNAVGDIDAVLLRVNADTLDRLAAQLSTVGRYQGDPIGSALALADAYLSFVTRNAGLWSMLLERSPLDATPEWYAAPRERLIAIVSDVLAPLFPDAGERHRAVLALWAALQGVASLAAGGNLAFGLDPNAAAATARSLVRRYLTGRED